MNLWIKETKNVKGHFLEIYLAINLKELKKQSNITKMQQQILSSLNNGKKVQKLIFVWQNANNPLADRVKRNI